MQNMYIQGRVKEVKAKNVDLELIRWVFVISEEREIGGLVMYKGYNSKAIDGLVTDLGENLSK